MRNRFPVLGFGFRPSVPFSGQLKLRPAHYIWDYRRQSIIDGVSQISEIVSRSMVSESGHRIRFPAHRSCDPSITSILTYIHHRRRFPNRRNRFASRVSVSCHRSRFPAKGSCDPPLTSGFTYTNRRQRFPNNRNRFPASGAGFRPSVPFSGQVKLRPIYYIRHYIRRSSAAFPE